MIDNPYFISFLFGFGGGVWSSVWCVRRLSSFRSPRYYGRRGRRLGRSGW